MPTREGDTFVLSFGDPANPPLVLLHGSAANSSTWGGEAATWARHFRVYAIDLPGETGMSTQHRPPYAGTTYADWLADVLDGLELEQSAFCGLSLGGWASLKFAAHYPGRAGRIALIAPGGVVQGKVAFMLKAALYQRLGTWGNNRMAALIFGPNAAPPGVAEGFAFMLKHYRARRDNLPPLSDEELRAVVAPVFLVGGEHDALLNMPRTLDRLARLVPDFRGRLIPGAGHAILGMAEEVTAWLAADMETPGLVAAPAS